MSTTRSCQQLDIRRCTVVVAIVITLALVAGTVAAAPTVQSTSGDTVEPGGEATVNATVNNTQNVTVTFPSGWTANDLTATPAAANVSNQSDRVKWMYNGNQSSVEVSLDLAVPSGTSPGQYTINVTGEDNGSNTVNETVTVTVESPNKSPNASFSASPTEPNVSETVRLNASNSSDPDGSIASYAWDLDGDGQYDDATGETTTTSYSSPGSKTIALQVTDNESATDNTTRTVTVQQPATFNVSNFSAPSSALKGKTISVNATVTNTGDRAGSVDVKYVFNGSTVSNQSVTLDAGNSTEVAFTRSTGDLSERTYTHGVHAGTNSSTAQIKIREFVEVVGVDASGFTTIRAFVNVNTTAGRNGNLTVDNFTVTENGVAQSVDSLQFTQNESETSLDIVYVFDRTGSMSDEIDDLRRQIKNVSNNLNDSGRDVRFALVTYNRNIRTDQNLTRNVTKLENALDAVSTSGGTELAYDAIDRGLQQRFRGDAQKVVITITDEEVNRDSNSPNISQMTTRIQQKGVNFVAISPPRSELASQDPELDLRELANRTGGVWYDIDGAQFTEIIEDITGRLSTTYIVTYDTTSQVQKSRSRTVNVTVADPSGARDSALGAYIPPQVDITDVNTSGFPTINATVDVNTTNARNGNLTAQNFSISEDGSQRTIQAVRFDSQSETYEIQYESPDPAQNGTLRSIELTTNLSGGATAIVTGDYRAPGTPTNRLPNVTFTVTPTNPDVGETVTFNASNSTDPDGSIVSYEWDLDGDGTYDDATGVEVNTSYGSSGSQQVRLRINDSDGGTNTTSKVIQIGDTQTVDSGGQPGFGVGVAVLALLAVALFVARRP